MISIFKISFLFCALFCVTIQEAGAYDWDKCRRAWLSQPGSSFAISTMSPVQFSSSWGACSALGEPEHSKEAFFNDNYYLVKRDFALSHGEFKDVFIAFFNCNSDGEVFLTKKVRENFEQIFERNFSNRAQKLTDESIEQAYNRFISFLVSDEKILKNCSSIK